MMSVRILVTGSRDWSDAWAIERAIAHYLRGLDMWDDEFGMPTGPITLMHGGCTKGADFIADQWGLNTFTNIEVFRADWKMFGLRAGQLRNEAMVKAGADVCLAFINPCTKDGCKHRLLHGSHGASKCADLAEAAGIETIRDRRVAQPVP
jgi:SLOG family YspA-like protein